MDNYVVDKYYEKEDLAMNLRMRRILLVFIVLTMLFSVLACSKKTADVKSDEKTSPSVQDQVDKKQGILKRKRKRRA